jgi:hypothetical protein
VDGQTFRALQILALEAVLSEEYEALYRRICRWYSREFSTPLVEVEKMLEETVLRTYFEDVYSTLKESGDKGEEKLDEIVQDFLSSQDKSADAQAEDDEWAKQMNEEAARDWEGEKDQQNQSEPQKPNLLGESIDLQGGFDPQDLKDPSELPDPEDES